MKQIDVKEYGRVRFVTLTREQRDGLLSCQGDLSLSPEEGCDDQWCIRAGSFVGMVVTPGLTLRVRPKLSITRLFVMLSAAIGSIRWDHQTTGLGDSSEVEDVVASVFAEAIHRGIVGGLLRGYVAEQEESFVVRGRLDFAETLRRRPVAMAPLVQEPEFLNESTPENRILATALAHLAPRVSTASVRSRLVGCQHAFHGVPVISRGAPLPRVYRNRLNSGWWGAVELALLVLRSCGLDLPSGSRSSRSFLVDMNRVFEKFVYGALASELRSLGHVLEDNRSGLYLDTDGLHSLRPDLSVWSGVKCAFAGDCKYKDKGEAAARRDDLYQCLAYAAGAGLPHITLVYGGGGHGSRDIGIVSGGTTIRVRTLDLAAPAEKLRGQFAALATEVAQSL